MQNPQKIIKEIGDKRCAVHLIPQEGFRELSSQDLPQYPHLMKMTNRQEKVFHKPLLKGNNGMDLFVHVKDGKPFLFYILDKKERVVLMSEETKKQLSLGL